MIHISQCSCEDKLKEYLKSLAQSLAHSQHSETHGFIFSFSMILSMESVVSMDLLSNLPSFISQFYPELARQACVCVCVCVCARAQLLSHICLFVTPWTEAHQTSLSVGFSRQEYWSGYPFSSLGDLPNSGFKSGSPELQADTLPCEPSGKPSQVSTQKTE